MTVHTRVLPLENGRNFRDLGGYVTSDGRSVRWRHLFRSGTLAQLTTVDHGILNGLDIRAVCDLRTTDERLAEPSAWPPEAVRLLSWDYQLDHGAVMGVFRLGVPTPEQVRGAVMGFYLTAPEDFAGRFAAIFSLLNAGEAPLVIHCTAGKDRTGVAAAIVLRALGVPADVVIEDYALSDRLVDYEGLYSSRNSQNNGSWAFLAELSPEVRAPLMASEPAYLEAMFSSLNRRYGSLDGYLASRLGVTGEVLARIRNLYLDR